MPIRIAVLSLLLVAVTSCNRSSTLPSATNSATNAKLNTAQKTTAPTARSQRLEAGETANLRGYRDGYGDATVGDPRNPDRWLPSLNFTPADQQLYREGYNRGYDSVTPAPTPSPTPTLTPTPIPTGSVTLERRRELEQYAYREGYNDAQTSQAANPDRGIFILNLTKPEEIQIYKAAYNNGFSQRPSPSPLPSVSFGRLTELTQQGDTDGYNDARLNLPQDSGRGISRLALVDAAEQQAYISGYTNGYQRYFDRGIVGNW
ncbi:MAG: hypothetical protein KME27_09835 [Lyngbya sp. HA4199-MV5]|jgi:hypothetical protein|nr:hypothetical protein [Lyngbya sp. HA4199-MV5]